jgi:hypothetical protein
MLPADMYFACLDGSWNDNHDKYWGEGFLVIPYDNPDLYAELYQGRIPVSTVELTEVMIDKIIQYETPCDPSYTDRYLFLAEVLFPEGWKNPDPITLNGADFAEFVYATDLAGKPLDIVRMYETDWLYAGSVPESKQAAMDSMETGFNFVNQIGHGFRFVMSVGDASIQVGDADALTNGCRYMNLYMLNCTAAAYNFYCLGEHFLANPNGGAVSVVGANNSAYPNASGYYMNEYHDLIFDRDVVHIGEAFARSRLPRTPVAATGDNIDLWTHYIYTILADPEMPLYTGAVGTVDVAHVGSVGLGTTSILVNVTSGGQPVDSAYVCLSKGDEDYEYGSTNALGNAVFDFTAETAGAITVVVTGLNLSRHESAITVTPSGGAYVSFASHTVDDNTSGGSFGNSDGVIDAGETIDMVLSVKNTGGASTGTVSVVLRSSSPGVTIADSTANVGTVTAGQTKAATDAVRVVFSSGIADETAVEFRLVVKNNGVVTWNDRFKREVHAPGLELTTLRIDDGAPLGNGNGVNEAGEQFRLYYGLKNYGTGLASALTATLVALDPFFVFYDVTDSYGALGSYVEGENVAGFHIQETDVSAEHRLEVVVTDLFSRVYRDTIELRVPLPPTALVLDSGYGVDRIECSWTKSASPDAARYQVYRSLVSGGPYLPVSGDLVDHTMFMDTGLSPSTRYYYVVTAVDRSGNESARSAEGTASTNPPQLSGWPLEAMASSSSPPAVGDIDGDGDLEVVVGSKYVYAWHHDGTELVDGDDDAQTWGVLSNEGATSTFTAAVSLASLDNTPGLDIVGAEIATKKVYCFSYTGELLPGWPQAGAYDFRAAPVAGDLDGDGFCEVIAVDSQGAIYAWRADGSEYRDGDGNPSTHGIFYRTPLAAFHFQTPSLCDIDGDHMDEIILGTRSDSVYALNGDGSRVPGWPFMMAGESAGSPAVGDVDGDGDLEIIVQSKGNYGKVYLLHHDGTLATGWPRTIGLRDIYFTSSPGLADFDGDGDLEIVAYGWDAISSRIYVFNHTGQDYPGWPIVASQNYSEASLAIGDLDGDGTPEIVFGDESRLVHAFNIGGQEVDGFPVTTQEAVRAAPFICDLDGDGHTNLVVFGWDRGVYVWDLDGAYDSEATPWPTFQANVHRNGQIGFEVSSPTAIGDDDENVVPTRSALHPNYPNPFNPVTRVSFDVPEGGPRRVTIRIYDVTGALVRTLVDDSLPAGRYDREWDGRDGRGNLVGTGVYFCQLRHAGTTATRKLVLLK